MPIESEKILQYLDKTDGVERKIVDYYRRNDFNSYEEVVAKIARAGQFYPEEFVPALEVCNSALGPGEELVLSGDQKITKSFFHHGDLKVEGNLKVIAPFAVTGTLDVFGCVRDCGPDSTVIVCGDVNLHSLYTDGEFAVGGDLNAQGVVYGYYNDNTLCASTIRGRLVIADDHGVIVNNVESPHYFDIDRYRQGYGDGVSEELQKILVPGVLGNGSRALVDKERLFELLMRSENVFL
jgi:hypothetical protein